MKHSIIVLENNEKYIHKICFFFTILMLRLNIVSIKNKTLSKNCLKTSRPI
jgi:hypothetical protein